MDSKATYTIAGVSVLVLILVGVVVGVLAATDKLAPSPSAPREPVSKTPSKLVNGAPILAVARASCSPLSAGHAGLVPCTKQSTCNGCVEFAEGGTEYACVPVTGGNGALTETGDLVQPTRITFAVPPTLQPCSNHGTVVDGKCVCEEGFVGKDCEMYNKDIYTPGSYCLPAYALQCASPTTMSVYNNYNTGAGGQYTCACKPEYTGLFVQTTNGGLCDTPLICNASAPQMDAAQQLPRTYAVWTGNDANGSPQFTSKPVYTNRVGSHDLFNTEACVAKTSPPTLRSAGDSGKAYKEIYPAPDADPTCKPQLQSNLCVALGQAGVLVKVRGSGRPGDPLIERVSPNFYPPVPPGLQRCPDGFSGRNSTNSPCVCACGGQPGCQCKTGDTLQLKPLTQSYCRDPSALQPNTPRTYASTFANAAFDDSGEWNGTFTCLHDLRNAKARIGATGPEMDVSSLKWATVNGDAPVSEVSCMSGYNNVNYVYRSDYNATAQTYPMAAGCVDGMCTGVRGMRTRAWDGDRDGPLTDEEGKPWFATPEVPGTVAQASYGGQCECDGIAYRRAASGGTCTNGKCVYLTGDPLASLNGMACTSTSDCTVMPVPLVPERLNPDAGSDGWWKCTPDTCWSATLPQAYLDASDPKFPKCVCNTKPASPQAPYNTYLSFRPVNQLPQCMSDPCNPLGFHSNSEVTCQDDAGCGGKCYNNRCHYPVSTDAQTCTSDAQCNALSYASNTGRCIPVTLPDGTQTKKCAYEDVDRAAAGTYCNADAECSYGRCVTSGSDAYGLPVVRTCSGGCACSKDGVQTVNNQNPVGFTCTSKCTASPCQNGGVCSVDEKGKQTCTCPPCFTGDRCQYTAVAARLGERCSLDGKYGGTCCEGQCKASYGGTYCTL